MKKAIRTTLIAAALSMGLVAAWSQQPTPPKPKPTPGPTNPTPACPMPTTTTGGPTGGSPCSIDGI